MLIHVVSDLHHFLDGGVRSPALILHPVIGGEPSRPVTAARAVKEDTLAGGACFGYGGVELFEKLSADGNSRDLDEVVDDFGARTLRPQSLGVFSTLAVQRENLFNAELAYFFDVVLVRLAGPVNRIRAVRIDLMKTV